jgi:hypothetical protein
MTYWFVSYEASFPDNRIAKICRVDHSPRPEASIPEDPEDLVSFGTHRPPLVAASYCSTTLAGMRPRSLTATPWSFAHARMSPLR